MALLGHYDEKWQNIFFVLLNLELKYTEASFFFCSNIANNDKQVSFSFKVAFTKLN